MPNRIILVTTVLLMFACASSDTASNAQLETTPRRSRIPLAHTSTVGSSSGSRGVSVFQPPDSQGLQARVAVPGMW